MPVLKLEKQVATGLVRAGLSGRDSVLVVAVSGGTDSVSLLQCLFRLRGEHQLSLHIAHLNHNFRQEADDDAHFVAASARRMGLPATVAKRNPYEHQRKHHISSFEQAARELRYAFLAEVAGEVGAEAVALAHTRDDLAETVLLHLLRGSGLHGLRGMTEISPWPWPTGGHYLTMFRPLLELSKAETRQYCQELDLEYREDPSNYLLRFTRNRLRHELLPLLSRRYNPGIQNALARLARTVALEVDYLEEEVTRVWPLVATHQDQWVSFSRAGFRGLHPLMQRLVLRRGYSTLAGDTARLEETHLNDMAQMVTAHSGHVLDLPDGLRLHSLYDRLILCHDDRLPCPFPPFKGEPVVALPTLNGPETSFQIGSWLVRTQILAADSSLLQTLPLEGSRLEESGATPDPLVAYLDRTSLADQVIVRIRRPGDRFHPLGMKAEKKLQDFFTDARAPRTWRDRIPLLVSEGRIAWVVGYRVAEWAKVRKARVETSAKPPVVRISFSPAQ